MSFLRGRSAGKDTLTLYLKCDQLQLTFKERAEEVQVPPEAQNGGAFSEERVEGGAGSPH